MRLYPFETTPRPKDQARLKVESCGVICIGIYTKMYDMIICENGNAQGWDQIGVMNYFKVLGHE